MTHGQPTPVLGRAQRTAAGTTGNPFQPDGGTP